MYCQKLYLDKAGAYYLQGGKRFMYLLFSRTANFSSVFVTFRLFKIFSPLSALKPSAGKLFIHTAFLHFNADTEVKNLYDEPVTDSQFLSRSLVKSFAIAAAQARYIYGVSSNSPYFMSNGPLLFSISNCAEGCSSMD